jgi:alkanesulfonate monooxygenase SsuD/methylene tetrahydromethanopterin reductase-like flavin-dependent oxidoreductase (luciferase family)
MEHSMHFGLFSLMTQRDRDKAPKEIFAETARQVELAEEIGFDIAWFAEHHFSNYCLCASPVAMATYMAGRTSRIRLGTAVVVAPLYQPLRLLEDLAFLDTVSGGRAVLGFGSGYQQYEFHKFGVDLKDGRGIFLETLDLLEQFLSNGVVHYQGQHIRVPESHFTVRMTQPSPAIYVAGLGSDPETQGRVARAGYVPFFNAGWGTLDTVMDARSNVNAAHAAVTGKQAEAPYALQQYVFVTDDRDEALRAADGARYIRRIALAMRNKYAEISGSFLKETPAPDEPSLEEIVDRIAVGDPQKCAAHIIRQIEALRPTHMSCCMNLPGIPPKRTLRSMERFGGEVVPQIRKHFGDLRAVGAPEPRRGPDSLPRPAPRQTAPAT